MDSLRGSSVKIGTIQRRLAWPLRKDDTHKSRSMKIDARMTHTRKDDTHTHKSSNIIVLIYAEHI